MKVESEKRKRERKGNAETQRTHSESESEIAGWRRRKRSPFGNFSFLTFDYELLAGEALEVGHLRGHFLAGGVGGGANTLNAQLEFVGVGGARQGFVERDELLRVEVEERLIERLHAVLAGAGGDGVMNQTRLVRVDDAIADVTGGDHDFAGGNAAIVIRAAHQPLRDDRLQRGGKLQANLLLLRRREDRDDTLNRFRGVEGVQGG